MRAAVVYEPGQTPQYVTDFPEPIVQSKDEVLISVKAAAIKHFDRSRASGEHYSVRGELSKAKIIGGDGVGILKDGTRVFAFANGMIAEKAVVEKDRVIKIPDALDDITAAALPNAVAGSAMALRFRAGMKKGETVLVNGATGFTGKIALQIAKYYGAKKIIVTGRNEETLESLRALGADEIVSLKHSDEDFCARIKEIHDRTPIDVVIDYLWGHSAELILSSLMGHDTFTHKTRFVSIGSMTGDKIQLSSEILRSTDLQISGSGLGSWTRPEVKEFLHDILPAMFKLAAQNKIKVDTVSIKLSDFKRVWDMEISNGKRLVITM